MDSNESKVGEVLDKFHHAASVADGKTYFNLFAPNGVFIGTDDTERWTLEEFKKFAEPHFSKGKGWTYTVAKRHITFSPDGSVAWFYEQLDNAKIGRTRGSGVLVKYKDDWKVAEYVLSIPVPNDIAESVAAQVKSVSKK